MTKRTAGLTLRQAQTLQLLYRYRNGYGTPHQHGEPERGWYRAVDLGGEARSNHSHWLRNLANRGLVDTKPYRAPTGAGASYARIYRISAAGIATWENYLTK